MNNLAFITLDGTLVTLVILAALVVFGSRLILKFLPSSPESAFIQKVVAFFKGLGLVIEADEQKIVAVVKAELAKLSAKTVANPVTSAPSKIS